MMSVLTLQTSTRKQWKETRKTKRNSRSIGGKQQTRIQQIQIFSQHLFIKLLSVLCPNLTDSSLSTRNRWMVTHGKPKDKNSYHSSKMPKHTRDSMKCLRAWDRCELSCDRFWPSCPNSGIACLSFFFTPHERTNPWTLFQNTNTAKKRDFWTWFLFTCSLVTVYLSSFGSLFYTMMVFGWDMELEIIKR